MYLRPFLSHRKKIHPYERKRLWFLGFPVQYLFWLHNMVAEGGLEPPTSGL